MVEFPANPSSVHRAGQRARNAVETAREEVAAAIGAEPNEIYFTSGATEADNHALTAGLELRPGGALVTSQVEHPAVLATARALERRGRRVTFLPPGPSGAVEVGTVAAALEPDVGLVALMLVNNETGARTDLRAVVQLAREAGALVFTDAVQAFGFEPLDVRDLGVDMLAISGHKVYGPKGVGALFVRQGLQLPPLLHGGEQERGLRPGTVPTPAVVGLGVAARLAAERVGAHRAEVQRLRDVFEAGLAGLEGVIVQGAGAPRGVKHSSVTVRGVDGESLLLALDLDGLCVSAGSACAAGSVSPSHVLTAMGLDEAGARSTIRFSFGRGLTEETVLEAARRFRRAVERTRDLTRA